MVKLAAKKGINGIKNNKKVKIESIVIQFSSEIASKINHQSLNADSIILNIPTFGNYFIMIKSEEKHSYFCFG